MEDYSINRKTFGLKHLLFFTFVISAIFFYFGFYRNVNSENVSSEVSYGEIYYPTQYSDGHITKNAIDTNPNFKNYSILDKKSNLSNVISSISSRSTGEDSNTLENGTWLWTDVLNITPAYRDKIISDLKTNNITNIYLSIDTYLDIYVMQNGEEKERKQAIFNETLRSFIEEANKNGITVDAEAGWRNWAEEGNEYKAFVILDYVINFNENHTEKFRGIQYDIEPYLLSDFQTNSKSILTNFISLADKLVYKISNNDLNISFAIPDFYDGKNNWIPKIYYGEKIGYPFEHLINILDRKSNSRLFLMSYRNFSSGDDGSVDISKDEIEIANKYKTKVIIAQETGDVNPYYFTFFNTSRVYYDKQIKEIEDAFSKDKSFGGIATHYINAFTELK